MKAERKTWLIIINECSYHETSSKAQTAITAALLNFHLDHLKHDMTELNIYCHLLSPEEEERVKNFPKHMKKTQDDSSIMLNKSCEIRASARSRRAR